jgi:hypothetical protein
MGTMYQPDEAPLELHGSELLEIQKVVDDMHGKAQFVSGKRPLREDAIDQVFNSEKKKMWHHAD